MPFLKYDRRTSVSASQIWVGVDAVDEETQLHVARHTLCGEIAMSTKESHIEAKFHLFTELGNKMRRDKGT
jgi:hypothetical protein